MGNSLQEELLKAGLVTEKQLKEANRPRPRRSDRKRKKSRSRGRDAKREETSAPEPSPPPARHALEVNKRRTARFVRDPSLGAGASAENARKALRRKIRELVESECVNDAGAELAYNFVRGKRIKRVFVTEEQRTRLIKGELAIAAVEGNHYLLSNETADALLGLAPESFVFRAGDAGITDTEFSDSESGEHPVPDDVGW